MYLTYDEYVSRGGNLDETSFHNIELDAETIINWYTFDRLTTMTTLDERVKACMFKLIDVVVAKQKVFASDIANNAPIKSQENDGVLITYETLNASELLTTADKELEQIVSRYLMSVKDEHNRPVLYRGLYPNE